MYRASFNDRLVFLLGLLCGTFAYLMVKFMDLNFTTIIEISMFNLSSIEFSILIILDKISVSFGFVVMLISFCVFSFASFYMKEDPFFNRFIIILAMFVLSMNLLIYSGSIFLILMGWDGLGITSFVLIIYYQNKDSLSAGFLTLIVNRLGDALIVSSMFFLVVLTQMNIFPMNNNMFYLTMILMVASLTKSAQYPFCPWLPAAMAAPTPVSALVHSSTLVTAGVYLTIRLSINNPLSEEGMMLLCFCGSITCFLGGASAIWEMDLKKMIALSTLSQLGLMMFSLGMNYPMMALFHLYTHAMFKASLFLVAGVILMMSYGIQDLRLLGGVMIKSPILIVFQNISSLCLVGAPFLSAFYSKHCILELMIMSDLNFISVLIMMIATICTTVYVFRSLKIMCWGKIIINFNNHYKSKYLFIPLMILSFMGVMSGKLFLILNNSVSFSFFLPFSFSLVMNMMIIISMFVGLFLTVSMSSQVFSTLFFLSQSLNKLSKLYSIISKNVKSLDYGWLSPKYYLYPAFFKAVNFSNNLFLWPQVTQYSFKRAMILLFLIFSYGNMFVN